MNKLRYTEDDLSKPELPYKRNFINSLGGFKSIALCGTVDMKNNENLAIFNSVVHIGSNPPLLGLISRPATTRRDTLTNIRSTGYFTLNHIKKEFYIKAHQTAARYYQDKSEFEMVGLKSMYSSGIPAPYVDDASVKVGLKYVEDYTIKRNGCIFIVGEIIETMVPASAVLSDGLIDLNVAGSLTSSGLDTYYSARKIARLSFAKPDEDLNIIG